MKEYIESEEWQNGELEEDTESKEEIRVSKIRKEIAVKLREIANLIEQL